MSHAVYNKRHGGIRSETLSEVSISLLMLCTDTWQSPPALLPWSPTCSSPPQFVYIALTGRGS